MQIHCSYGLFSRYYCYCCNIPAVAVALFFRTAIVVVALVVGAVLISFRVVCVPIIPFLQAGGFVCAVVLNGCCSLCCSGYVSQSPQCSCCVWWRSGWWAWCPQWCWSRFSLYCRCCNYDCVLVSCCWRFCPRYWRFSNTRLEQYLVSKLPFFSLAWNNLILKWNNIR